MSFGSIIRQKALPVQGSARLVFPGVWGYTNQERAGAFALFIRRKKDIRLLRHEKETKKTNPIMEILSYLAYIAAGVLLALLIRHFVACPVRVIGWSMEPTLYENNILVMTPASYRLHAPERYDIVIVKKPNVSDGTLLVKRVIGLPGETVSVRDGFILINGQELTDDVYGAEPIHYEMKEVTVPEGSVFVLGDNRNQSTDSHVIGPVTIREVQGKVQFSLIPMRRVYD